MTLGMRIRLWARQAPRLHVVVTGVVVVALFAALAVAAVPEDDGSTVAVGAPSPLFPGASKAPASAVGQAPSPDPASPPAAPEAGPSPTAEVSVPSTSAASVARRQDAAASGTQTPDAARSSTRPVTPPPEAAAATSTTMAGSARAAAPAPAQGKAPAPPVERTASDQGVTKDEIKVGFLLVSFANLDAAGFAFGQRQDREAAIKAYVDDLNRRGGLHGRKVTYTVVKADPFNAASARQACIELTSDEKVFAVLNGGGAVGSNVACYAERKVPNIFATSQTVSESLYRQGNGYLVAMGASGTRSLLNWALYALGTGAIGPGKGKLGILSDECPPDPEMMDRDLKPFLAERGVDVVEARVSCDIGLAQQQIPGAVLQMRQAGVRHMFFAVLFPSAQSFIQQAEAQGFRPRYHVSDFWALNTDFSAKNFPAAAFDGTKSITFTHSGADPAGVPVSEPVKRCGQALQDAGLPGITDQMGADAEVIVLCDAFNLWAQAAGRAPVNLTREDWVRSLASFGPYASAYPERAVFGPGKFNGGDSYAEIEWRRSCSCWFQIRKHEPARL